MHRRERARRAREYSNELEIFSLCRSVAHLAKLQQSGLKDDLFGRLGHRYSALITSAGERVAPQTIAARKVNEITVVIATKALKCSFPEALVVSKSAEFGGSQL
jgi:hypothetical protein